MSSLTPNAQRLLRSLVLNGPTYRADLARSLDVSRATVTNLVTRLQEDGWIEESDPEPGALKNLIGTAPRLGVLGSVLFLVETATVVLSTLDGRVLREFTQSENLGSTTEQRVHAAADALDGMLAELGLSPADLRALHLAVDTQMDAQTGDVYSPRASSRWYGINPKQFFAQRYGVPVHTQNTARLEGLAEFLWGHGRGHRNMLYVDVSYGVTSSHVVDGIIQSGARGGSGELGHTVYDWSGPLCTCGNAGCLMQYTSVPAMLRDLRTASGQDLDWTQFTRAVDEHDPAASAVVRRAATVLGRVIVNACHVVDPELLVLSGEVVRGLPRFVEDVAHIVREHALPLVSRNLLIAGAELEETRVTTARAGIDSLRAIDEVATAATML